MSPKELNYIEDALGHEQFFTEVNLCWNANYPKSPNHRLCYNNLGGKPNQH